MSVASRRLLGFRGKSSIGWFWDAWETLRRYPTTQKHRHLRPVLTFSWKSDLSSNDCNYRKNATIARPCEVSSSPFRHPILSAFSFVLKQDGASLEKPWLRIACWVCLILYFRRPTPRLSWAAQSRLNRPNKTFMSLYSWGGGATFSLSCGYLDVCCWSHVQSTWWTRVIAHRHKDQLDADRDTSWTSRCLS